MKKYIFVVGGVMSSVGKGVVTSSISLILKDKGFKVTAVKADPYINVDAGTMNPVEHGEVFVTEDADETDQDIGNYERFLDQNIKRTNYMTTGRVYQTVIKKERNLEYEGKCVEVVPHIPQEIIRRIEIASKDSDITIVEIGGTVGEYQNILFLEAARMMKMKNPKDVSFVLVSYLPIPSSVGEMKTKPTQYAARTLNGAGIQADFIICRSQREIDKPRREKLATFCMIESENAISCPDVSNIYEVPLIFEKQNLGNKILKSLHLKGKKSDLKTWKETVEKASSPKGEISLAVVGKYFGTGDFTLADSYISVIESIKIACFHLGIKPKLEWINSEIFEKDPEKIKLLNNFQGIIVPGGFGSRGIEGIIMTCEFARKNNIPYLGLCYGMQIATIEFARNVAGLDKANTEEIDPKTPYPVIHLMNEQKDKLLQKDLGGTMRLGGYKCRLKKGSIAYNAYKKDEIIERHRHRYEFNNKFKEKLEKLGLNISGINPERKLVEIVELKNHPFYVGVQFHPEFNTRFLKPHPLFTKLIEEALKKKVS
jgi:CTP synthase